MEVESVAEFVYTAVELDARHALAKLNGKSIQRGLPVANWHGPFLTDIV